MDDALVIKMPKAEKIKIPDALIQATLDTIKAGIRLDEKEKEEKEAREAAQKAKSKKQPGGVGIVKDRLKALKKKELVSDEDLTVERTYRAHEDRRGGFLIIGDQHRLSGQSGKYLYLEEPPLDYSFCLLNNIEEILEQNEPPQTRRNFKQPKKTDDERYRTSSVRLSYNVITSLVGFEGTLYKILDGGPFGLCWLDLSFNNITNFEEDIFPQLVNLRILYLHGNNIGDMLEIQKISASPLLRHLTLHGNPIEQDDAYRVAVLFYMPYLKHLDFIAVTKGDLATSGQFGKFYEEHWEKKHVELEAKAKAFKESQEMSLTARMMQAAPDDDDDDDDY